MRVEVTSGEARTVSDLHHWLVRDTDLRRCARITTESDPASGTMGAVDVIAVVLTHTVAIGNFALAVAAYRRARPTASAITCTVDGMTVSVSGPPDVAERAIRDFLEARAGLPPGDDTHPS